MRTQRRTITIIITRENVTEDALGNETDQPSGRTITGCQFDPDPQAERSSSDQAKVLRTGFLNIPGSHQLISDDVVKFNGSTWLVVGGSNVWRDRTKVRVQQAGAR